MTFEISLSRAKILNVLYNPNSELTPKRTAFLQIYIEALVSDLKRGEGGALVLTWACYDAGRHSSKLFDAADPLARHRFLASDQYAIDRLLEVRRQFPEFVLLFLSQFSEEIRIDAYF